MSEEVKVVDQKKIKTDMKKPPSLPHLKEDLRETSQYHDTICNKLDRWKRVLSAEKSPSLKNRKGRSKYVAKLARRQAEWTYSDISEPFLNAPKLFTVSGQTQQDMAAATQNSLILNNQYNHQMNKTNLFDRIAHVVVDEGTVILKAGWNFEEGMKDEEVPNYGFRDIDPNDPASAQILGMYQQVGAMYEANQQIPANIPPEIIAGFKASVQTGRQLVAVEDGTKIVKKKYTKVNSPRIDVYSIRDVIIDPNANGDITNAKFVIHKFKISKSEMLVAGNYHNIDAIPDDHHNDHSDDSIYKEDKNNFNYKDKAMQLYDIYEYWGFADIDDTGIVQPFIASWIGDVLVKLERHSLPEMGIPFEIIKYMEVFEENYGEPDAELIADNQKLSSAIMRGMVDTLSRSSAGQRAVRENMLDPINFKRFTNGQDFNVRGNVAPENIFHTFTYPEIGQTAPFVLDMMTREAESLSGTQPFGADGQKTTQSVGGQKLALDATIKRKMSIIRRVTAGIVSITRKIMVMNSAFLDEEEVVRITDKEYVTVMRDDLQGNFDLKLSVTSAEKNEIQAQELAFMLQTNAASSDPGEVKMIRIKAARLRGMDDLADQIQAYQPEPDPLAVATAEANLELIKAQIKDAEGRAHENFANGEYDLERVKTERLKQAKLEAEIAQLDLDFIETESGVKQERNKEIAHINNDSKERIQEKRDKTKGTKPK